MLSGHRRHVDVFVAPVVVEYVPALHFVHTVLPLAFSNVPGGHGVGDVAPEPDT